MVLESVKISHPLDVTPTECSNCAERDLSRVTAVQSSAKTLVSAIEIGPISPGTSHIPVLIDWTASPGNGQSLFAETFSLSDPNSGNNEWRLDFDVRSAPRYLIGTVLGSTIPSPAAGQTEAVIDNGINPINDDQDINININLFKY